tara:strand:+ start:1375 stop:1641 length:267 start_codon:yes stop_codon:yes gene_type:complete
MKHSEFSIGKDFTCGGTRYRCTDIGSRVVVAIRTENIEAGTRVASGQTSIRTIDAAEATEDGWLSGPPYAVAETVFDEEDLKVCDPIT